MWSLVNFKCTTFYKLIIVISLLSFQNLFQSLHVQQFNWHCPFILINHLFVITVILSDPASWIVPTLKNSTVSHTWTMSTNCHWLENIPPMSYWGFGLTYMFILSAFNLLRACGISQTHRHNCVSIQIKQNTMYFNIIIISFQNVSRCFRNRYYSWRHCRRKRWKLFFLAKTDTSINLWSQNKMQ